MRKNLTALAVLSAAAALADRHPFERYQTIIDRQMFGPPPPGFDPTKMPSEVVRSSGRQQEKELTKEQEKLQSSIRFSAINVTPEGATAVGFTDNSNPKTPVHYYLKVGESRDGWNVVSADAKTATMTIVKGDVEVTLTLGGSTTGGPAGGKGGGPAGDGKGGLSGSKLLNTLHARRAARESKTEAELAKMRAERDAERAERARRDEEEAAKREEERAEQRKQLQAIQDELRRAREEKAAKEAEKQQRESEEGNANNDAG